MHSYPLVHDLAGQMLTGHITGTPPQQAPTAVTGSSIPTGAVLTIVLGLIVIFLVRGGKMKLGPATWAVLFGLTLGATAIGAATLGWLGDTIGGFARSLNQ